MQEIKVLYVEDEPDMRMLAKMAMESVGGFVVHDCESGADAVASIQGGLKPDVLLLDFMMVPMDGTATLKELRKLPATAETPAIFLTGKAQPGETGAFIAAGAIGVIPKPFDPFNLAQQILDLLKKA